MSTVGVAPVTVTVSSNAPTLISAFTFAVKPSETSALKLAQNLATLTADGKLEAPKTLAIQCDVQALMFSTSFSDAQLKELRRLRCTLGQGHLFSPALEGDAVEEEVLTRYYPDLSKPGRREAGARLDVSW